MDECRLYSILLELKLPRKVEKGSKLPCPVCRVDRMVYDHLREIVWRYLDSVDFMTFIHASPPRISCPDHGIIEAVMPWAER